MNNFRKIFFLFSVLSGLANFSFAQDTKLNFKLLQLSQSESAAQTPIAVLIKGDVNYLREELPRIGGTFKFAAGNIISATVPADRIVALSLDPHVFRMEEGHLNLQPMNDRMLINNKIDKVQNGISPLTQGYNGSGVIVGVIDTGIDISHPDFKDSLGNTRILWVWDHVLATGPNAPQPYNYGQQFSASDINSGLASATDDLGAHGTHVTGIAASNGNTNIVFKGAAPKADIIAVRLNFNQADNSWLGSVADAVKYIFDKADSLNKPCVINISAGTYYGSHDGRDLAAQTIDNLISAQYGRSLVAAAGNAGNIAHHLQHLHASGGDTLLTWFYNTSAPIYIEMWADTADFKNIRVAIGADVTTPNIKSVAQKPFIGITGNVGVLKNDSIISNTGHRLATYQTYGQLIGNKYSFIYYINPDSAFDYFRLMSKGTGKFDVWSFDMINSGIPAPGFYPNISNYVYPDYNQTICSSFQCSEKVITSGQYVNRNNYIDYNGNLQTFPLTEGELAASSSKGPTRDGRNKPDITATGEYTMSALPTSAQAWFIANQPYKLAFDGKHIRDGGTSSAAPAVAGSIALYFQMNPNASWLDIKNRITLCAATDLFTGSSLPNNDWGHGKLDAFTLMTGCSASGIHELNNLTFDVYPNPANNVLQISNANSNKNTSVSIYNCTGAIVYAGILDANNKTIETSALTPGLYLIKLTSGDISGTRKILIQH
jgi:subtilisin family serine protease